MNHITAPLVGLVITLLNLICPVIVPFALLFAKWDTAPSTDSHGAGLVIRGDLPRWLCWLSTPDERLPGGFYEPAISSLYARRGRFITSWVWLGFRNCLMGMSKAAGFETTDYAPEAPGYWIRGDVWRYTWDMGPLRGIIGFQVYKLTTGQYWAFPCATIKRR